MKRLLIVSPHFPPVNAPDAQRVLGSLPHLHALGWETRVLCVDSRDIALPADTDTVTRLPKQVRVDCCRAWPLALTRLFGLRTLGPRARRPLWLAGRRIIKEWQPDLVFFSTTQNAVTAAGPWWKRELGVRFVVDVQDPWVTDYYDKPGAPKPPGGWKYAWSRRANARLEAKVFNTADGIVSVSADYLRELSARQTKLGSIPQRVLPFGVDVAAFSEAVANAPASFKREPGKIHLVSMGAIGPIMNAAITALCSQLSDLRRQDPALAARLRLHFIGTSYASAEAARSSVMPIATAHHVDDLIVETTARVSWREAQATMNAADGLIVLTSTDAAYTPSKLAGCFLAKRPALLVTGPDSATSRLGETLGLGTRMDIDRPSPGTLRMFLQDLQSVEPCWPSLRQEAEFNRLHTAEARTHELAAFFDQIVPAASVR